MNIRLGYGLIFDKVIQADAAFGRPVNADPFFYSGQFLIQLQPFVEVAERQVPLMVLAVGKVTSEMAQFADIREITELAAENRRRGGGEDDAPIDTEW